VIFPKRRDPPWVMVPLLPMNRRHFCQTTPAAALTATARASAAGRPPRLLLRSSWQVVNIGDIAHTPGVLALIEKHLPEAEVRLWASGDLSEEVIAMEHRRFPQLKIVKGSLGAEGEPSNPELGETLQWTDFLLHGSGPSLVAAKDVAAFVKHTGKPFGVYGITHGSFLSGNDKDLLSQAKFVFSGIPCRWSGRRRMGWPVRSWSLDRMAPLPAI